MGLACREALWSIKALRDEPLPLFAAASAREQPCTGWGHVLAGEPAAHADRVDAFSSHERILEAKVGV
jgi:hypothetical protein